MATQKYTLIIKNLHQNVTTEIIFVELKNRNFTPDNITISKPNGHVVQAFIQYKAKEQRDDAFHKLQFDEILGKQIQCSLYQPNESEQGKYKIFLKNIPKDADPKQIFNLWTQFGKIQSISIFRNTQGKPTGSGVIQLSSDEEVKKCLENYKQVIAEKEQLRGIEVIKFDKCSNTKKNGIIFRNIKLDEKILEGITPEKIGNFVSEQSQKIQKVFQDNGITVKNPSVILTKDQPAKAIIYIENANDIQTLIEQYDKQEGGKFFDILEQIGYNKDVEIAPMDDPYSDYQGIYIKDLALPEGEDEEFIKKILEKYMEQFGDLSNINVKKGEKPQVENIKYPDSYFATIFFKRGKSGLEFIKKYQQIKDKEFRNLFHNEQPYVTILLKKSLRRQMRKNILTHQKNESTQQQQLGNISAKPTMTGIPMAMMYNQQNMGPYNRRVVQNPQFNNLNNHHHHRQNQPKYHPGPANSQKQQTQPQNQPQVQPKQQNQEFSTIRQIQDNLQKFLLLEKSRQFQHLGLIMFPKVKAELEKDSQISNADQMAQKITGMMVDLTVFEVSEIIETLESAQDFKERLQEALELINQQSAN